jgi:hypothetical protein
MPAEQRSFEGMVLAARAQDRERYGTALAAVRGPAPNSKTLTEQQQDEMWAYADPQWADPMAFGMLMLPQEQGGEGLTPLAASYRKYPHRQLLVEGAGASIDDQIAYADSRRKRMLARQSAADPTPLTAQAGDSPEQMQAQPEPMTPTAPATDPTEQMQVQPEPMVEQAQPTVAPEGTY